MVPENSDKGMGNATRDGRNVIKTVAIVSRWSSILLGSSGIQCSVKPVSELCQPKARKLRWKEWFPPTCPACLSRVQHRQRDEGVRSDIVWAGKCGLMQVRPPEHLLEGTKGL